MQRGVIEEASLEEITVGVLVAVECENYKDELPLIAKVLKINAETLVVYGWVENSMETCKETIWKATGSLDGYDSQREHKAF